MNLRNEAQSQGLSSTEYDLILKQLGREPNSVELGIFAVMWSEHCCYKSSRMHLKKLPTVGPLVLQGPGENAGLIDVGDGYALAFKIESHNHPSFIEPFQGAATGVGGILRDIFTMGARPIAILDSLHFGDIAVERMPYLIHGVVSGISFYGNCMGIPNVGGETHFASSYNGNILVNAMAVGLARKEDLHRAVAKGEGNVVMYIGAATGKDGVHGATMASEEFDENSEERRPTVQVGDPFTEKLLMEASLQMMQEKLLIGIQDMGAAGITCSTFEMSEKGRCGMEVDLDRVPLRDPTLTPYEIFLSESQERMLLVAQPQHVSRIHAIARHWGIFSAEVGFVIPESRVRAYYRGELVVDLPVAPLTSLAPIYDRPSIDTPPSLRSLTCDDSMLANLTIDDVIKTLIQSSAVVSKASVFRQYDSTIGTSTVIGPGADAAVIRFKHNNSGIAVCVDSNANLCKVNPYLGIQHVVAETVRNLACVGARAVAVTNCLNFGNPECPDVMGQFRLTIDGLRDAVNVFETPVTGGNVSFYNQTKGSNIDPTPTIGMVGLVPDVSRVVLPWFSRAKAMIACLSSPRSEDRLYASEFARVILKQNDLACPPIDLRNERNLQQALLKMIESKLILSAHDCAAGGLGCALVESMLGTDHDLGCRVTTPIGRQPLLYWFGESPGQILISFDQSSTQGIERITSDYHCVLDILGSVTVDQTLTLDDQRMPLSDLAVGYFSSEWSA